MKNYNVYKLFPTPIYHSVNENLSKDDRIIVSFNVDIEN